MGMISPGLLRDIIEEGPDDQYYKNRIAELEDKVRKLEETKKHLLNTIHNQKVRIKQLKQGW